MRHFRWSVNWSREPVQLPFAMYHLATFEKFFQVQVFPWPVFAAILRFCAILGPMAQQAPRSLRWDTLQTWWLEATQVALQLSRLTPGSTVEAQTQLPLLTALTASSRRSHTTESTVCIQLRKKNPCLWVTALLFFNVAGCGLPARLETVSAAFEACRPAIAREHGEVNAELMPRLRQQSEFGSGSRSTTRSHRMSHCSKEWEQSCKTVNFTTPFCFLFGTSALLLYCQHVQMQRGSLFKNYWFFFLHQWPIL